MGHLRLFIGRIASSQEKRVLLENFFSLSFLQAANYLLPLVTLPYLVRVLGPEKFGLVAFAAAFIQYFVVFADYGFNFSATREVSICRDDPRKVTEIFNSVMLIKAVFAVASAIILILAVASVPRFRADWPVYACTFGMVVGNVLFPAWFFQGMERMKYIAALHIVGKIIFTAAIFVFVRRQQDFLLVPLITSCGLIISGLAGLYVARRSFNVRFVFPGLAHIRHQFAEGWHTFLSTMTITLYTNTNTFVLGLFAGNTVVGYYSAAEKLVNAIQKMLTALSQSVYPYISKLAARSRERSAAFVEKMAQSVGAVFLAVSLFILIFAEPIIGIFFGPSYRDSVIVLRIMAFVPLIVALSNIFAVQGLFALGRQRIVSIYIALSALIYLPVMTVATYYFRQVGTAACVLMVETVITILSRHYYIRALEEQDV